MHLSPQKYSPEHRVTCSELVFFSSRRRHTRLVSDWSSAVCSSDRSEEHTSELQSLTNLVYRLPLEVRRVLFPSIATAHVLTPVTDQSRIPACAWDTTTTSTSGMLR